MKRFFSILMACVVLLSLAACGATENRGYPENASSLTDSTERDIAASAPASSQDPGSANSSTEDNIPPRIAAQENHSGELTTMKMKVQVGDRAFTATLAENAAVDALVRMMGTEPVSIQMHDYSGFEKVGSLGTSLPVSNRQTTAQAGDIILYNGNQIVVFYGSNSWSYTRLGRIDDLTGWEEALGSGDVTVTFSLN